MKADVLFVEMQLFRRKQQKHGRFMDGALNSVDVSPLLKLWLCAWLPLLAFTKILWFVFDLIYVWSCGF